MQKLVPKLFGKINCVCHYRNLQFYVKHGLVLSKIYRVILFDQNPGLEPWIAYCTERRKMAGNEFESDLAKLQANATFAKTMEQVRHRVNVRLICDPNKLAQAVSRPTFRLAEIINDDLTLVRGARQRVTLNKPIFVGLAFSIFPSPNTWTAVNCFFTDTDSFCCHIQREDLYKDMTENIDLFDTSNFEQTHLLYTKTNHRIVGKFKSETGTLAPLEFVRLRAKMYSLLVPQNVKECKIRAKGIKKVVCKKRRFDKINF